MDYSFLDSLPDCPTEYSESLSLKSNICGEYHKKPIFGNVPVGFSLASCFASIFGSLLTILPYILWKDVRSGVREIITFLAVADFFTAFGYIIASFNYLRFEQYHTIDIVQACREFDIVCQIQSYISSWASLSSFFWTSILAFYLYWTIAKGDMKHMNRFFPLYHVLSWGFPICIMFPLLITGSLGYSQISAGGWCFIRDRRSLSTYEYETTFETYKIDIPTILLVLVGGKAVEIFTYCWVIILYIMIQYKIRKSKQEMRDGVANLLQRVERKMFAIPVMFIILRMWGTIQFLITIIVFNNDKFVDKHTGCMPNGLYYIYYILAVLQSIGDGGQGWCNFILYIIWAPKIRHRLGMCLCSCCYEFTSLFFESLSIKRREMSVNNMRTTDSTSFLPINYQNGNEQENEKVSLMETISKDKQNN